MKKLSLTLGIALMLCTQLLNAQDIFKQYGFTKDPITLSNGQYNEFFNNNEVVQIGTVLLNTQTSQIVAFVEEDTVKASYLAELSSRWLSIDPLAAKYSEVSPYVYVLNNPLIFIDPDGNEVRIAKNIVNTTSYKLFSSTQMGKNLVSRFGNGSMSAHTLSISTASYGGFSAYVVNGNEKTHISKVSADQLKGNYKFEFDISTRVGTENSGEGTEILGHEAFLHGEKTINGIQSLIENGIQGEDLAKSLNGLGIASQIIYNGEIIRPVTGSGGADHAKIVTGEDKELQGYVKQAKGASSNENTKSEIQNKYDYDKNQYKNDPWIQWWNNNK